MELTNGSQPEIPRAKNGENGEPSKLQLRLAAGIVDRLIEANAGREVADAFWDDDSFDVLDDYDPDLVCADPNEETLPEMAEIWHNIYPCD
jgi:hypothetical protein